MIIRNCLLFCICLGCSTSVHLWSCSHCQCLSSINVLLSFCFCLQRLKYSDDFRNLDIGLFNVIKTRGQSNLTKAASNAPRVLTITIAVPKIWRGSQKLKVGHVTQRRTRIWPVAWFSLRSPPLYTQAKFKSLALAVPEIWWGSQNLKVGPLPLSVGDQDPRLTQCFMSPQGCSLRTTRWSTWQTDWRSDKTPRTSVRMDCISCIRCSLIKRLWALAFIWTRLSFNHVADHLHDLLFYYELSQVIFESH